LAVPGIPGIFWAGRLWCGRFCSGPLKKQLESGKPSGAFLASFRRLLFFCFYQMDAEEAYLLFPDYFYLFFTLF